MTQRKHIYQYKNLENILAIIITLFALCNCHSERVLAKSILGEQQEKKPYSLFPKMLSPDIIQLETDTWTARPGSMSQLEQKLISKLQEYPKSAFLHYLLSHIYLRRYLEDGLQLKNLKTAGELADQAIQLSPNDEFGHLAIAHILNVLGKQEQARLVIERFLVDPLSVSSWRTRLQYVKLLGPQQKTKHQLLTMEELMQSGANPQLVIPFTIVLLEQTYSGAELLEHFRFWTKAYPHPVMSMSLALNLSRQKKYKEANKVLVALRKKGIDDSRYPEAAVNQAMLLYQHLEKPRRAREILQAALNASKGDKMIAGMMNTHIGIIWLRENEYEKAKRSFLTALTQSQENHWGTLSHIVRKYSEADAFLSLVELVEALILKMPGDDKHHGLLGELYAQHFSGSSKALSSYENAALLNPIEADYWTKIGFIHYQSKDFKNAETSFEKAARLKPEDALALYNHACALALNQEVDSALLVLERALDIDAELKKLAKNDKDFFALRDLPHFRLLTSHLNSQEPQ